jgi:hypothetical protein
MEEMRERERFSHKMKGKRYERKIKGESVKGIKCGWK